MDFTSFAYEDSVLVVTWMPGPIYFDLQLENKSTNEIKIHWQNAAIINEQGERLTIRRDGESFAAQYSEQASTVIAKGATIIDRVLPANNVYHMSTEYEHGMERGIFEPYASMDAVALQIAKEHIGRKVYILLPMEIEGCVHEYLFTFQVNDVSIPRERI